MSRVMPITGALAAVMLAAAPGARAQVTSSQDSATSPWPTVGRDPGFGGSALADTAYIRQAIRGNSTEVELSKLAESRAANADVKEFAQRMISEHNSMNQQWGTLGRNNGMKGEVTFGKAKDESIERLEDLSGAEFDQSYMAEMIRRHEQDLAAFEQMEKSARSTEVRQLAKSGVSTIREHLALAQQVGSRVGVATTAARTGGVTVPAPAPYDTARRRTAADSVNREKSGERNRRPLRAEDRGFVEGLLSDHLMEIRLAKRAQREAKRADTRRLAERMEKEFTNWADRWENFADRRDAGVTSHLERQHREKLERLEKASERKNFDHAYAAIVADHLESLVDDFREERLEKRPGVVGRLAKEELPVLRDLLERARRLEKQTD